MTAEEVSRSAHVCVIGTDVEEKFFPIGSPDRKDREGTRRSAQVIGVEDKRGSFLGQFAWTGTYTFRSPCLAQQIFTRTGGMQFTASPR